MVLKMLAYFVCCFFLIPCSVLSQSTDGFINITEVVTEEIDYKALCRNNPCQNGGNCSLNGTSYVCECPKPYKGKNCTEGCSCQNGYCEIDKNGKVVCICRPEYGYLTKSYCKACQCGKDSNCTFGGFWTTEKTCICKKNYKEKDGTCKGPCNPNPCKNGGNCTDVDNDFQCSCATNYRGKTCEEKYYKLTSTEPEQSSTRSTNMGYFSTVNKSSTVRITKEINKSTTSTEEEQESTFSIDKSTAIFESTPAVIIDKVCRFVKYQYICECPPEYGETDDLFSTRTVCKACECGIGANCTFERSGRYYSKKCICPEYSYQFNEKCIDKLTSTVQSSTRSTNMGYFSTVSKTSTVRTTQEITKTASTGEAQESTFSIDKSTAVFESTPAVIIDKVCRYVKNRYICECPPEYGETEDLFSCKACECGTGANCTFERSGRYYSKKCICPDYSYEFKEKCIGTCGSSPCLNGGTCREYLRGYRCSCKNGYSGNNCQKSKKEKKSACYSRPCLNGGTCIENYYRSYNCFCKYGYSGTNCEDKKRYCWSTACENGGTCNEVINYDGVSRGYECICRIGYKGMWCTEKDTTSSTILQAIFIPLGLVIFLVIIICIIRRRRMNKNPGQIIIENDPRAVVHQPPPFYVDPPNPPVVPDHVSDRPSLYPTLFEAEHRSEQPPPYHY